ncbi:hypothetical protein H1230_13225 [Paenibacillus sp. 19GGS1-52]|uniref:hypothetical protein n=1 Tax=Paenibacillus sp. 19GGS1-52 TaxID=2758563 RepID=UPI001EFBEA90|nr:hypothetical protein [Paenibacillus sp. 19GGS1-52]ULO09642.1 hypothetical protein H1230_13225 [Paenibacillus sp. 19GGS1-52]
MRIGGGPVVAKPGELIFLGLFIIMPIGMALDYGIGGAVLYLVILITSGIGYHLWQERKWDKDLSLFYKQIERSGYKRFYYIRNLKDTPSSDNYYNISDIQVNKRNEVIISHFRNLDHPNKVFTFSHSNTKGFRSGTHLKLDRLFDTIVLRTHKADIYGLIAGHYDGYFVFERR